MKKTALTILFIISIGVRLQAQSIENPIERYWEIGLGFGEIPMQGSFKPSIRVGFHFNDKLYTGIIYQTKDEIQRNGSSFNAKSTELGGLASAKESVGQRFMLQIRYKPLERGPFISSGFVYNGTDTEYMTFGAQERMIGSQNHNDEIRITSTRPGGWGFALGLGYQYEFYNRWSAEFEWTPAWLQLPTASYLIESDLKLTEESESMLVRRLHDGFDDSPTNLYKVFHIGFAYKFKGGN